MNIRDIGLLVGDIAHYYSLFVLAEVQRGDLLTFKLADPQHYRWCTTVVPHAQAQRPATISDAISEFCAWFISDTSVLYAPATLIHMVRIGHYDTLTT